MSTLTITDIKGNTETITTDDNREMEIPSKKQTDYRERLLAEYVTLVIRIDRLKNYLLSLPENQEADKMTDAMWEQVSAMDGYERALNKRLLLVMGVEVEE